MKRERYNLKKKHDLSSSEEEWTCQEEAEEDGAPPTDSGYSTGSLSSSPPPKKSRKRPPRKQKTPQKRAKPKEEVGWVNPGVVPVPPPMPTAPPPPPLPVIPQKYPPRTAPSARTPRRIKPVKVEPQSQADQWPPNHRHNRKNSGSGSQTSLLETLCQAYAAYAAAKTQQKKKPTGWRAAVRQAYEKVKKNARREDAPAQAEPHHPNPSTPPQEE